MHLHKHLRLTPSDRRWIWKLYTEEEKSVTFLADFFNVSRPTIYKVIKRARLQDFIPRDSSNARWRCLPYGIRRLAKIEASIEAKQKAEAKRYNKAYPGEMLHVDTKRLPLLKGEKKTGSREYLFVAIDDFSRELYAAILPDKSAVSATSFIKQVIEECPYTIEVLYSDNGTEYKGNEDHPLVTLCTNNHIQQKYTQPARPQTNGKAERVIRTLMEGWHNEIFNSREERKKQLARYLNYYNSVKPHKGIQSDTPYERLIKHFFGR